MPPRSRTKPTPSLAVPDLPVAPHPGPSPIHPWRFRLGEWVHVRGFGGLTVRIEDGFFYRGMPHYRVRSTLGDIWKIPQLHISSNVV